jgi:uncharacterized repeat protein (TIGR03803 family)
MMHALTPTRVWLTIAFAFAAVCAPAQEHILHTFATTGDGISPWSSLVSDASGNLYGTTTGGGTFNQGTVFELVRPAGGAWTEKILYNFGSNSNDGSFPEAGVIFDRAGNLYGTTFYGTPTSQTNTGTVYELSPPTTVGGDWTETILYGFGTVQGNIGSGIGGLVFGLHGSLFGVTVYGGNGLGGVFELRPPSTTGGAWQEHMIYTFTGGLDGQEPEYGCAGLTTDSAGNLYGTAVFGGATGNGTVFKLSPHVGGGSWIETTLYSFGANSTDGIVPVSNVLFDQTGNLYGSTSFGGSGGKGTVFELSPPTVAGNPWTENILYNFSGPDGQEIRAGVIFDAGGNLYGTSYNGGTATHPNGTVFKLTPPGTTGAPWTETVLHSFTGGLDGGQPYAGLLLDRNGILLGTTSTGGTKPCFSLSGCGVAFAIRP